MCMRGTRKVSSCGYVGNWQGSDACLVNGVDVYEEVRKMGKFVMVPRTRGISTTDIVGRMLLFAKEHHQKKSAMSAPSRLDEVKHELAPASFRAGSNGFLAVYHPFYCTRTTRVLACSFM